MIKIIIQGDENKNDIHKNKTKANKLIFLHPENENDKIQHEHESCCMIHFA